MIKKKININIQQENQRFIFKATSYIKNKNMEANWNDLLTDTLIEKGVRIDSIEEIVTVFKEKLNENNLKIIKSI